jgi:hypothetical protein
MAAIHDNKAVALQSFKDWSNYLLVTTVGLAGWVASDHVRFRSVRWETLALWCLGVSIVFGILALALVPLIAQQMTEEHTSIYGVPVNFHVFGVRCSAYLSQACRPQHITFMVGVIALCLGTTRYLWIGAAVALLAMANGLLSRRWRGLPNSERVPGGIQRREAREPASSRSAVEK